MEAPLGIQLLPNWNRVLSAVPDFFDLLQQSVGTGVQFAGSYVS
jgi:hypothetical protein